MSDAVESRLGKLPEEVVTVFRNELFDCLNDRDWCRLYGIKFSNPDVPKAKEILFKERYQAVTH